MFNEAKQIPIHDPQLQAYWDNFVVRYTSPKVEKTFEVIGPNPIYPSSTIFENKIIVMGIDQSTSCTGICIAEYRTDKTLVPIFFVDIINRSRAGRSLYCRMFAEWLDFNIPLINPRFIVYESVRQNASEKNARTWLQEMARVIRKRSRNMDVMEDEIMPAIWRKHLLADKCYAGRKGTRAEAKAASLEEVVKRFPRTKEYMEDKVHRGIDHSFDSVDSVDAYGIIDGYLKECFIDGDISKPRVTSMMKDTPRRVFNSSYSISSADYLKEKQESTDFVYLIALNATFSLEENYRKIINRFPKGIIYAYPTNEVMLQKMRIHSGIVGATNLFVRITNGEDF